MNPHALLSMLITARAQLPEALDTPFLLQRTPHASSSLFHPTLPQEGVVVDAETHEAFQTLVQWGYLMQPKQHEGAGYIVTEGGLSYAEHADGGLWNGRDRRQPRPLGKEYPTYMDRRSKD